MQIHNSKSHYRLDGRTADVLASISLPPDFVRAKSQLHISQAQHIYRRSRNQSLLTACSKTFSEYGNLTVKISQDCRQPQTSPCEEAILQIKPLRLKA